MIAQAFKPCVMYLETSKGGGMKILHNQILVLCQNKSASQEYKFKLKVSEIMWQEQKQSDLM